MLWKRLNDHGKNWRHVYKSLVVLEYLVKNGSERVVRQCQDNLFSIQTLKDFQFLDKDGKDQGSKGEREGMRDAPQVHTPPLSKAQDGDSLAYACTCSIYVCTWVILCVCVYIYSARESKVPCVTAQGPREAEGGEGEGQTGSVQTPARALQWRYQWGLWEDTEVSGGRGGWE